MIAANSITLGMDVTSSVNPRCRDERSATTAAHQAAGVAGIDQIGLEQVYDFDSKVTAVRAAAAAAAAAGASAMLASFLCCCLQTHLLHTDAQAAPLRSQVFVSAERRNTHRLVGKKGRDGESSS